MNIVITGASAGIGLALAQRFAAQGHQVFNLDVQRPVAEAAATWIRCDLTSGRSIKAAINKLPKRVELLIHNAGVMRRGNVLDMTQQDFDLLNGVFLRGPWLLTQLLRSRVTRVVLISSFHVTAGSTSPAPYVLFKQAATMLVKLLELPTTFCFMGPVSTELAVWGKRGAARKNSQRITPEQAAAHIQRAIDTGKQLHYSPVSNRYSLRQRA